MIIPDGCIIGVGDSRYVPSDDRQSTICPALLIPCTNAFESRLFHGGEIVKFTARVKERSTRAAAEIFSHLAAVIECYWL